MRPLIACCLLLAAMAAVAGAQSGADENVTDLAGGVFRGELRVEAKSLGTTYGDCVIATITNTGSGEIEVRGIAGTLLRPVSHRGTRIVLADVTGLTLPGGKAQVVDSIRLKPGASARYTFRAFSAEFAGRDARNGDAYEIDRRDELFARLFALADKRGANLRTVQAAVWLRGGGITDERLAERMGISGADVLDARALLDAAARGAGGGK